MQEYVNEDVIKNIKLQNTSDPPQVCVLISNTFYRIKVYNYFEQILWQD